jgi:UDP-N-acetylmuramoyl-tripeptide--D-alanyl-D-alanine ligase
MTSNATVVDAAWSIADVLEATGGRVARLEGPPRFAAISTDTRKLGAADVFVALRGVNHDGHAFVPEAIRRGAGALILERCAVVPADVRGVTVIEVADGLRAYGDLAAFHRRRLGLRVAAVTGSNGKTTTKEMIGSIMTVALGVDRVLKTTGTENNLVGVPLTLLRATRAERVAVLEMGMNAPGEIARLTAIADPDVGVVTCVAPAHIAGLGDIEGIARAKGELYRGLRPSATAVVNADDPRVSAAAAGFAGRIVRFGAGAEVCAEGVRSLGTEGVECTLRMGDGARPLRVPLPGLHNIGNALAAAAVARELGATMDAIVAGIAALPRLPMRMEVVKLPGGITVLNDAYNANPGSMQSAFDLLETLSAGTKIAVLGAMRELGPASAELHRQVGRVAAGRVDLLIVVGDEAAPIRAGALEAGLPSGAAVAVTSHDQAAARVREAMAPGACVLIKGSRGARMEEVLRHLRGEA